MAKMLVEVTAKDTGPLKTENHKIKVLPSAQPDDYHSGVMTVSYILKECKMQCLSEEQYLGKHQIKREDKDKRGSRKFWY